LRHHYIPQFYLRPWLGADHKLQEFRRGYGGKVQTGRYGPGSTGYVDDLYALPGVSDKTRHKIESMFMAPVDNSAALARDLLLQGLIPTGELRPVWARFLLSLLMRSPEQIRTFKSKIVGDWQNPSVALQARYQAERKPNWPATFEQMMLTVEPELAERTGILMATHLMQNEKVLTLFMSAMWNVLDVSQHTDMRFMTSDHPVIMTNGLGREDGHFALAISPTHLFAGFMNQEIMKAIKGLHPDVIVDDVNKLVIGQGRKYVYALDKGPLELVRAGMATLDYMTFFPEES